MDFKEIFCFHNYEFFGIDYTTTPYTYAIKCKKCGKRKYLFGKEPKCSKVPDSEFCAIDNELTSYLREMGHLPKCRSCSFFKHK